MCIRAKSCSISSRANNARHLSIESKQRGCRKPLWQSGPDVSRARSRFGVAALLGVCGVVGNKPPAMRMRDDFQGSLRVAFFCLRSGGHGLPLKIILNAK